MQMQIVYYFTNKAITRTEKIIIIIEAYMPEAWWPATITTACKSANESPKIT
jgi:hypothetical protein